MLRRLILATLLLAACSSGKDSASKEPVRADDAGEAAAKDTPPPPAEDDAAAAAPGDASTTAPAPSDGGVTAGKAAQGGSAGSEERPAAEGPPRDLRVLPKRWSRERVDEYMESQVSRGLGVKCEFCHDVKDYAANDNPHKKIARAMMRMTRDMNRRYFGGKSTLTCFTCHKGEKEP